MRKVFSVLTAVFLTLSCSSISSFAGKSKQSYIEDLLFMEIPVVISSTLNESNVLTAPSVMTVITAKDIRNMGIKSLMDLVNKIPGFSALENETRRKVIAFRGITSQLSNDKFKLMINGHTVADATWSDFSNFYNVSLENVKQVEIIRGPGSAIYGTNAFGGLINVITKTPADMDNLKVDVKYQSYNTTRSDISVKKMTGSVEVGISANILKTDGNEIYLEKDTLKGGFNGVTALSAYSITPGRDKNKENSSNVNLDLRYKDLCLYASLVNSELHRPVSQVYFTQDNEDMVHKFYFTELKFNHKMTDAMSLRAKASIDIMNYEDKLQALPRAFALPDSLLDGNTTPETWPNGLHAKNLYDSTEYRAEAIVDYKLAENNTLLFGLFSEQTDRTNVKMYSSAHPIYVYVLGNGVDLTETLPWNKDSTRTINGAFFQDELNITKDLYMILGGRYDNYSDFGNTFNPRTGLVWDFNEKGGIAKLLYGTAFKAPTASQLYNQNNPSLVGNINLKPETLDSIELALSYITKEKLKTDLSIYSLKTSNLIDVSQTKVAVTPFVQARFYENRGKSEVWGIELDNKYNLTKETYLYAGYYYTDAQDKLNNIRVPFIAQHQAALGLNWNFMKKLNWYIGADYTGEITRELSDPRSNLKATTVVDTNLRAENIVKGLDLYLSVYNLTDEAVVSPTSYSLYPMSDIQQAGVNYSVGATYKF